MIPASMKLQYHEMENINALRMHTNTNYDSKIEIHVVAYREQSYLLWANELDHTIEKHKNS